MYAEKIDALKTKMSDMISLAKEEQRSLTEEELAVCADAKAEIERLRKSAEIESLSAEWDEEKKAEVRKARQIKPEKADVAEVDERASMRNYILRGQVEGTDAYGGYTVPTKIADQIVAVRDADNWVRKLGTVVNISGPTTIPVESTDLTAYWVAEGGSYTEGTQSFAGAALTPYKLTALDTLTEELLADSAFDLVGYLVGKIGRILGQAEETAFIKGATGSNQPNGILSSGITVTRTAANNAVTAAEIQGLFYGLEPQYARNATWLISGGLAAALAGLTTGTGGIFAWGGNLAEGAPATLMGRPCYISKDLDAVTTNKIVAICGDFSYYFIGDQGGIQIQRLNELYAASGKVGLRFTERVGGVLTNTAAFKVLGTKTT
jgi:HK97 family phage major capsid protein